MRASDSLGVIDIKNLRERTRIFRDRVHAGEVLAQILPAEQMPGALVLGIPAGGLPVAQTVAQHHGLPLDVAVVSKITLPWNTEVGYGAVAFDGTVRLNTELVTWLALSDEQVQAGVAKTRAKVQRRLERLRGAKPWPALRGRIVLAVDDGLASGFTLLVAVKALQKAGAGHIWAAVPTGHDESLARLAPEVDALYCANVRSGPRFAVADAYRRWTDVQESELSQWLGPPAGVQNA